MSAAEIEAQQAPVTALGIECAWCESTIGRYPRTQWSGDRGRLHVVVTRDESRPPARRWQVMVLCVDGDYLAPTLSVSQQAPTLPEADERVGDVLRRISAALQGWA